MLTHLPEPKAQAMINKEEKMNIKQNETNLKTNELIHVVKNEQLTEKQKIKTEANQHRAHIHQIPVALPQDGAHGKAWEVTRGQTGTEARREQRTAPRMTRGQPQPTTQRYRLSSTSAESAWRSLNRGTGCSNICARRTT